MRLNVLVVALLALSACATSPSSIAPSTGPWRFSGTVVAMEGDRPGRPIAGAELTVVSGVNSSARVTSDPAGHYVFTSLDAGRFTVAIVAPGFISVSPVVDLYRDLDAKFALTPQ